MVQGRLLSYGDNLHEVFSIRKRVFVDELGISEENEFDDQENEAIHVLVYKSDQLNNAQKDVNNTENISVATGRIVYDGEKCIIGNVAVLKEYRGKEYGDFTVKMLLNKAFTAGINEVTVYSFQNTVGFFEKVGFHIVDNASNSYIKMIIGVNDIKKCCKI